MKVLFISYYAPPLGLSGVLRVTKFCRYLKEFGIEPVLLTTQPIAYYHYDEELLNEIKGIKIYRAESFDLARCAFLFWGKEIKRKGLPRFTFDLLFPDNKIGFFPFAYQLAKRIIPKEGVSLIFATSPPWTVLLLGVLLKRYFSLPLISDFRDPWPSGFIPPRRIYKRGISSLLSYIVENSEAITFVQKKIGEILGIEGYHLPNGYDLPVREAGRQSPEEVLPDQNNLLYTGNLFENEDAFLSLISSLGSGEIEVRLDICGGIRKGFLEKIRGYPFVNYLGLLSHKETFQLMRRSGFLLYVAKPNQEAGIKLYEYLGAKRPIIYLGPEDTEAERLIRATDSGIIIRRGEEIRDALESALKRGFQFLGVEEYSFKKKAGELAGIIRKVVKAEGIKI